MKTVSKYPWYQINEDGTEFFNTRTNRYLKTTKLKSGYVTATVIETKDSYWFKPVGVHRLVAYAYLPAPLPGQVWVNHKDGNKLNNHYTNLEWTTISENIQHAFDTGLHKVVTGKDHWNYGKKIGQVTRNRMSRKKLGELHPKFTGWYVVKGIKYGSAEEAHKATRIPRHTIYRRCKANVKGFQFVPK